MIVIVSDGFYRHVIARLEVRGFHFAHGREIFGRAVDLRVNGPVVPGIERQLGSGNRKQHPIERLDRRGGGPGRHDEGWQGQQRQGDKRAGKPARHRL